MNIEDIIRTGKTANVTITKSNESEVKSDHARPPLMVTYEDTPPKRSQSIGSSAACHDAVTKRSGRKGSNRGSDSGRGRGHDCDGPNDQRERRRTSRSSRRNSNSEYNEHQQMSTTTKVSVEAEIEDFLKRTSLMEDNNVKIRRKPNK